MPASNADTTGGNQAQYRINEVPWSEYTQDLQDTWPEYGDVALVVLARSGGEGADLPSGLPELEPYMTDGDYLQLCQEEIDMLTNLQQLKEQGVFKRSLCCSIPPTRCSWTFWTATALTRHCGSVTWA